MDYYKSQQRVFMVEDEVSSEADISIVTFSSPKKKILSQVYQVFHFCVYLIYFTIILVGKVSTGLKSYN